VKTGNRETKPVPRTFARNADCWLRRFRTALVDQCPCSRSRLERRSRAQPASDGAPGGGWNSHPLTAGRRQRSVLRGVGSVAASNPGAEYDRADVGSRSHSIEEDRDGDH
jgi:hypothetical protein